MEAVEAEQTGRCTYKKKAVELVRVWRGGRGCGIEVKKSRAVDRLMQLLWRLWDFFQNPFVFLYNTVHENTYCGKFSTHSKIIYSFGIILN